MNGAALALMIAAIAPAATDPRHAETDIRTLRAQYNTAIAAHDLAGMKAVFASDYHVLPGSSGTPSDLTAFDARIGGIFADLTFVTYVRTPIRVTVAASGKRAAETGRWTGHWRKPDGDMRLTGVYQAMWVPTAAGWRLKNESFVTLDCTGSQACPAID